jgi:hypothetical protein
MKKQRCSKQVVAQAETRKAKIKQSRCEPARKGENEKYTERKRERKRYR